MTFFVAAALLPWNLDAAGFVLILSSTHHGSGDLLFQMAWPQGRELVTEVGGSSGDVGRPLPEVAHPLGGAEGLTTPERSGRFYQLSIVLFV